MTKNRYYWQLVQGSSRYIMASHTDSCRKQWVKVLNEAKQVADVLQKLNKIRNLPSGSAIKATLSDREKRLISKFLKKFNKCLKQEYEVIDEVRYRVLIKLNLERRRRCKSRFQRWTRVLQVTFKIKFKWNWLERLFWDQVANYTSRKY